jgi:N-acetylglucosamine-6-phosphate deacetylase
VIEVIGHLYAPDYRGLRLVRVEGNQIAGIEPALGPVPGALGGPTARILPGLLDIQINGALGDDFADPAARMDPICRELPRFGVTGFAPTIVTSSPAAYRPALANLRRRNVPGEAAVLGVHIEGPFISPQQHGTHDPAHLRLPDVAETASWLEAGDVVWVTLAPELPGALDLVRFLVREGVRVSLGHTDATWSEASAAVDCGATMATHIFNAMRPFRHRDPGVAGFAMASHLRAGFIADGNHIAFETVRMLARIKALDELILVTDALAGLGMPPGRYWLGGREYISDGTCGRLPDGTLSGSLLPLNKALGNLVMKAGIEPAAAVRLATLNPALALGLEATHGRVGTGRPADLTVVDEGWNVLATIAGGVLAYDAATDSGAGDREASAAEAAGANAGTGRSK